MSESSSLVWLRSYIYNKRLSVRMTEVDWGRLLVRQHYQSCIDYVVQHSPFESERALRVSYSEWLNALDKGFPSIGDRPHQVGMFKRQGFSNREIAGMLGLSLTRVRECVRSWNKRTRRSNGLPH